MPHKSSISLHHKSLRRKLILLIKILSFRKIFVFDNIGSPVDRPKRYTYGSAKRARARDIVKISKFSQNFKSANDIYFCRRIVD